MEHLIKLVMDWGVVTLLSFLATACMAGGIYKQFTRNRRQDAMLLAIGQYRLIHSCERYLAQGYMSVQEIKALKLRIGERLEDNPKREEAIALLNRMRKHLN